MSLHTNFTSLSAQPPSQELRGSVSQPTPPAPPQKKTTMAIGRRIKGQETATLKQKYITPADVKMPMAAKISALSHYAIPINQIAAQLAAQANRIVNGPDGNRKTEIDGFYLLEVGGLSFPEDLQQINLADRKLSSVVDEDLTYFSELLYVDASENFLPLFPFGALPQLRELRLTCNHIEQIGELYGFEKLLYLDLSYNKIAAQSIADLGVLPLLKELDLSGNNLSTLPHDLSSFAMLEKLILDYNKFDDNALFLALASIPNLRILDVAHNFFSFLPNDAMEFHGFKFLEELDLAFNYFGSVESVQLLLKMPRLVRVLLYGNPVLGPTGEDPLFAYIEDLVEAAVAARDHSQTTLPDVDFVTEIPRRRLVKKGQPLGRLARYRDFSIVQVQDAPRREDGGLSARQWKARGLQTLFGESLAHHRRAGGVPPTATGTLLPPSSSSSSTAQLLPDMTFLTNSIAAHNLAHPAHGNNITFSAGGEGGPGGVRGPGGLDMDRLADDVMQKVAAEMGLLGGRDLRLLETWACLDAAGPAAAAAPPRGEEEEEEGEEDVWSLGGSTLASETDPAPANLLEEEEQQKREDRVPASLFSCGLQHQHAAGGGGGGPGPQQLAQPVALRTAMKALQHALAQPLTDYSDVPASSHARGAARHAHARHTAASHARQLPRIALLPTHNNNNTTTHAGHPGTGTGNPGSGMLSPSRSEKRSKSPGTGTRHPGSGTGTGTGPGSGRAGEDEDGRWDKRSQRFHRRGLAEAPALQQLRREARERTLGQIDAVLSQLNRHTQRLTAASSPSRGGAETEEEGGPTATVGQLRQSMENMRSFAKPKAGVDKLLGMISTIVDEFSS